MCWIATRIMENNTMGKEIGIWGGGCQTKKAPLRSSYLSKVCAGARCEVRVVKEGGM